MIQKTSFQILLLLASVLLVYGWSVQYDYVWYDDVNYILFNDLVTDFRWSRAGELFGSIRGNVTPVTWLTHVLTYALAGAEPGAHHAVNVLFHAANVILVFLLARILIETGPTQLVSDTHLYSLPFYTALLFAWPRASPTDR